MVLKAFTIRGVKLRSRLGFSGQTILMSLAVVGVIAMDAMQAVVAKAPAVFTAIDLLTGVVLTLQVYLIKRQNDHEKVTAPRFATISERLSHMPTKDEMNTAIRDEVHIVAGELEEKIVVVDERVTSLQKGV